MIQKAPAIFLRMSTAPDVPWGNPQKGGYPVKPAKKRTRILFLCILFCFVLYQILFPVRTLREVLEAREIYNLSDSYERKEYEDTYVLPEALPGLQQDVLGVRGTLPSFYDFELLSSQDTDQICKLLSSLKVRKKLGKYHEFSTQHRLENGYEYRIWFSWVSNLRITLCQKELCFETSPAFRYGSEKFNVYYLINCPENREVLEELENFLLQTFS